MTDRGFIILAQTNSQKVVKKNKNKKNNPQTKYAIKAEGTNPIYTHNNC